MPILTAVLSAVIFLLALSFSALTALSVLEEYREGTPDEVTRKSTRLMLALCCFLWSLFYLNFLFLP